MFGKKHKREQPEAFESNPGDRPAPPKQKVPEQAANHAAPSAVPGRVLASHDRLGQTVVVTVTVQTLSGPDAEELAEEIITWMNDEAHGGVARHIVFDLQNVQYMDSGCIGVMVELLRSIQNAGGRIAMVNAGHNVEYLFKLTRLDRLFPICRDVMRAIEVVERGH